MYCDYDFFLFSNSLHRHLFGYFTLCELLTQPCAFTISACFAGLTNFLMGSIDRGMMSFFKKKGLNMFLVSCLRFYPSSSSFSLRNLFSLRSPCL